MGIVRGTAAECGQVKKSIRGRKTIPTVRLIVQSPLDTEGHLAASVAAQMDIRRFAQKRLGRKFRKPSNAVEGRLIDLPLAKQNGVRRIEGNIMPDVFPRCRGREEQLTFLNKGLDVLSFDKRKRVLVEPVARRRHGVSRQRHTLNGICGHALDEATYLALVPGCQLSVVAQHIIAGAVGDAQSCRTIEERAGHAAAGLYLAGAAQLRVYQARQGLSSQRIGIERALLSALGHRVYDVAKGPPEPYLRVCCDRHCRQLLIRRRYRQSRVVSLTWDPPATQSEPDPIVEDLTDLRKFIRLLPQLGRYERILLVHLLAGESLAEQARQLRVSRQAVFQRKDRLVMRLRQLLARP